MLKKAGTPVDYTFPSVKSKPGTLSPLQICLIYTLIGGAWILFSDMILKMLVHQPDLLTRIQTVKGWFFTLGTASVLYLLINRGVRKARRFQKELEEREAMYRLVLEGTTDGMWDWHIGEDVIYVSPRWKEKLGGNCSGSQCRMSCWMDLVHPEDVERVNSYMEDFLARRIPQYRLEYRIKKHEGEYVWVMSKAQMIVDEDGKPVRLIGTHTDITTRKTSEEMLRKAMEDNEKLLNEAIQYDRLRTEFFNNVSHEFRTPLNLVLGSIQLIESFLKKGSPGISPETLFKYTRIMKQNSFRLLKLVNNLIDINIIDSGFTQLQKENHNIVELVENIVMSAEPYAAAKSISLTFDTEFERKMIACDLDKVERIILNLLSNAVKYTREGGAICVNVTDGGEKLRVSVRDTGIGIPKDKLDMVFERFRQVNASLTRENEGSGIGLFLVKQLVELHGGKIWVESEEGKGSEFIVELPAIVMANDGQCALSLSESRRVERINVEFSDITV